MCNCAFANERKREIFLNNESGKNVSYELTLETLFIFFGLGIKNGARNNLRLD